MDEKINQKAFIPNHYLNFSNLYDCEYDPR